LSWHINRKSSEGVEEFSLKMAILLGQKKNVKTADRLDRTHSMDQHDGHTLRRTASSVPNHAIAAKMAATTSAAKDVCKHGKNA